jgi:hypothetical protein
MIPAYLLLQLPELLLELLHLLHTRVVCPLQLLRVLLCRYQILILRLRPSHQRGVRQFLP